MESPLFHISFAISINHFSVLMSSQVVLWFAMQFPQFHDVDNVVSHAFNLLVPALAEMAAEQVSEGGSPPDFRWSGILSITCHSNLTPAVRFLSCMGMFAKPVGGDGLVALCCLAFHELFSLLDLHYRCWTRNTPGCLNNCRRRISRKGTG